MSCTARHLHISHSHVGVVRPACALLRTPDGSVSWMGGGLGLGAFAGGRGVFSGGSSPCVERFSSLLFSPSRSLSSLAGVHRIRRPASDTDSDSRTDLWRTGGRHSLALPLSSSAFLVLVLGSSAPFFPPPAAPSSAMSYAAVPQSPTGGLDALVSELSLGAPQPNQHLPPTRAGDAYAAVPGASTYDDHYHPPSSSPSAYPSSPPNLPSASAQHPQLSLPPHNAPAPAASTRPDSFYSPAPVAGLPPQLVPDSHQAPSPQPQPHSPAPMPADARPTSAAQGYAEQSVPPSPAPMGHAESAAAGSSAGPLSPHAIAMANGHQVPPPVSQGASTANSLRGVSPGFPPTTGMMASAASLIDSRPASPQPQMPFGGGYQPAILASASRIFDQGSQVLRPGVQASLMSHEKTLELYRQNAKKVQDPDLMYELAVFMIESSRSPSSSGGSSSQERSELIREAMALLRKISDRGHPDAQYFLADCYANALGSSTGKPQFDKAYPLFVLAAKHSHADAAYRAGTCTERGWGCRKDSSKAVQFFKKAAAQGHPGAMFRLAIAELNGDLGFKKNAKEGVKWIKLSADMATPEFPHALHELALLHERGIDNVIFLDPDYACELLAQAAELGYAPSAYKLGVNYEYGKMGCPQDAGLSIHMYNIAAQQNHKEACFALCAWYLVGAPGILPQSDTEAYLWAKKAAEQGLAKAEYAAGYFLEMGIGTKRNLPEAKAWYQSALEHGDKRASTRLASMGRITAATLSTSTVHNGAAGAGASPSTAHGTQAGRMPYAYPQTGYQGSAPRLPQGQGAGAGGAGGAGGAPALSPDAAGEEEEALPVAGTGLGVHPRPVSQAFGQPLRVPQHEGQFENAASAGTADPAPAAAAPAGEPEKKKKKGWFR